MKKFVNISLIVAGILFVTGAVILIICRIFAGSMHGVLTDTVSSQLHTTMGSIPLYSWSGIHNRHFNQHYPTHSGTFTDDSAALGSDITELCIDLNYTNFTLAPSQDDYFHISSEGIGKYQYYTEDSVFYINGFHDRSANTSRLILEVPDIRFSCVDVNFGAGTAALSSLKGDSIMLDIGAGQLTLNEIDCDYICADVGAGSVSIDNGKTLNADFDIGMGKLVYKGFIDSDLTADVGMGNITLQIADTQDAHNYDLEGAMGKITLGSKTYGGMAFETEIDNDADSTYSLECGMGNIDVSFQDTDKSEN